MCQRGKIQEESLYYEHKKHDGGLPLIGVNAFLPREHDGEVATSIELIHSSEDEKSQQINNGYACGEAHNGLPPDSTSTHQQTARETWSVFGQLMQALKYNSLGQVSHALYEVGGKSWHKL